MAAQPRVLNYDSLPDHVKHCEYAVRGELYRAATERVAAGKEVIFTNVGNPHGLGQKPITFIRQVFALVSAPFLLEHPDVHRIFPRDVIARAKAYMKAAPGGIGAYSDSKGLPIVRQEFADFLQRRDGFGSDIDKIFLTNGASEAVRLGLTAMLRGPQDGILVPIPQYPLYSAAIELLSGSMVGYYLHEESGWSLDFEELERAVRDAKRQGVRVRGMVFINPGNPTGQCLSRQDLEGLVKFAYKHKLVLMADEVYQDNIYQTVRPFVSARHVALSMGSPYAQGLELATFHTASKGVYGECGFRGGVMELLNFDERVADELYKLASINLSPNVPGQVILGLMVNGPRPGDESYAQYAREKQDLLDSLRRRARAITDAFNSCEGIVCQETEGAMYSFPKITLPPAAMAAAKAAGKSPDVFYCLKLLETTGISTVPGSGFKQRDGTFHFRTTILPPESKFQDIIQRFLAFHSAFMAEYKGSTGRGTGARARL